MLKSIGSYGNVEFNNDVKLNPGSGVHSVEMLRSMAPHAQGPTPSLSKKGTGMQWRDVRSKAPSLETTSGPSDVERSLSDTDSSCELTVKVWMGGKAYSVGMSCTAGSYLSWHTIDKFTGILALLLWSPEKELTKPQFDWVVAGAGSILITEDWGTTMDKFW